MGGSGREGMEEEDREGGEEMEKKEVEKNDADNWTFTFVPLVTSLKHV